MINFAEEINATIKLQLINLSSPPSFWKRLQKPSPYVFHGAFAPSFYGVDAPGYSVASVVVCRLSVTLW